MAQDTGMRKRWSDCDPLREGETVEDRAARQHDTDVIRLARAEMETGEPNPRLGQRENSGETAEGMQKEVRDRIVAIDAEFSPEDPRLARFKTQFEDAKLKAKNGHTWVEVVAAMKKGGQFKSVSEFLAATSKLENPSIYFTQENKLVIGDGNPEVPQETLGMSYFQAEEHCQPLGLDVIERDEWIKLQEVRGATELQFSTWFKANQADLDNDIAWDAHHASHGYVFTYGGAFRGLPNRGARRVLRVNLAFES